ncbi:MAG TPA: hypothetical protein VIH21_05830, partial [Dehalococcoidia bacterium]
MLVAAAAVPKSFERTLMPRKTRDQGVVTGLSMALTYAAGALSQDLIENTAAYMMRRQESDEPGDGEEDALRGATMMFDLGAAVAGLALQRALREQENEVLGRAAMRTGGYMLTLTGLAGFSAGFLQDVLGQFGGGRQSRRNSIAVAVIGGGAMAALVEYLLRRRERAAAIDGPGAGEADQDWTVRAGRSLLIGGGVTGALAALAVAEHTLAGIT